MFYRQYRPQKFSELFGLEKVTAVLKNQLKDKKIGHAYLFYGPRGTGKTTTARILAKALVCENPVGVEPCAVCKNCVAVSEGRYLDLIEIDAASHGLVEDARDLRDKINLAPTVGKYKIYIIDEAHMLSTSAFNALLKTLEEPPPHAIFVLATTELHKIPETIKSRCLRFEFPRASLKDIASKLRYILKKEGSEIDENGLNYVLRQAQGGFRDAETILEQYLSGNYKITTSGTDDLPLSPLIFISLLSKKDANEVIRFILSLDRSGTNISEFGKEMQFLLHELLLLSAGLRPEGRSDPEQLMMQEILNLIGREGILNLISLSDDASQAAKWSTIQTLPLEVLALKFVALDNFSVNTAGNLRENSDFQAVKVDDATKVVWFKFLDSVKPRSNSLAAFLRSARVRFISDSKIEIDVLYPFHFQKLSEPENMSVLNDAAESVFGKESRVELFLVEGGNK